MSKDARIRNIMLWFVGSHDVWKHYMADSLWLMWSEWTAVKGLHLPALHSLTTRRTVAVSTNHQDVQ